MSTYANQNIPGFERQKCMMSCYLLRPENLSEIKLTSYEKITKIMNKK